MLTPEECKATIEFLDRCTLKGHVERQAMNLIISKLQTAMNPPVPEEIPTGKAPKGKK